MTFFAKYNFLTIIVLFTILHTKTMPGENNNEMYQQNNALSIDSEVDKFISETQNQLQDLSKKILETNSDTIDWLQASDAIKMSYLIWNFYEKKWDLIVFHLNKVSEFLNIVLKRLQKDDITKFNDFQKELIFWWTILAVQITLESIVRKNSKDDYYDVWIINWKLDENTVNALKDFQRDYNLSSDWKPGRNTISSILNILKAKWIETSTTSLDKSDFLFMDKIQISNIINMIKVPYNITMWFINTDKIVDYLQNNKYWTGENIQIEQQIGALYNADTKWDFKKIVDEYPSKSLSEILYNQNLLFWNPSRIKSSPSEKSKKWTTLCSATAQKNWRKFWINLPSWNAWLASLEKPIDPAYTDSIPSLSSKPSELQRQKKFLTIDDFNKQSSVNFADIYTNSKSPHWHRATAFKWDDWSRYVLDPYHSWGGDPNRSQPIEEYMDRVNILKANLYKKEK